MRKPQPHNNQHLNQDSILRQQQSSSDQDLQKDQLIAKLKRKLNNKSRALNRSKKINKQIKTSQKIQKKNNNNDFSNTTIKQLSSKKNSLKDISFEARVVAKSDLKYNPRENQMFQYFNVVVITSEGQCLFLRFSQNVDTIAQKDRNSVNLFDFIQKYKIYQFKWPKDNIPFDQKKEGLIGWEVRSYLFGEKSEIKELQEDESIPHYPTLNQEIQISEMPNMKNNEVVDVRGIIIHQRITQDKQGREIWIRDRSSVSYIIIPNYENLILENGSNLTIKNVKFDIEKRKILQTKYTVYGDQSVIQVNQDSQDNSFHRNENIEMIVKECINQKNFLDFHMDSDGYLFIEDLYSYQICPSCQSEEIFKAQADQAIIYCCRECQKLSYNPKFSLLLKGKFWDYSGKDIDVIIQDQVGKELFVLDPPFNFNEFTKDKQMEYLKKECRVYVQLKISFDDKTGQYKPNYEIIQIEQY